MTTYKTIKLSVPFVLFCVTTLSWSLLLVRLQGEIKPAPQIAQHVELSNDSLANAVASDH